MFKFVEVAPGPVLFPLHHSAASLVLETDLGVVLVIL